MAAKKKASKKKTAKKQASEEVLETSTPDSKIHVKGGFKVWAPEGTNFVESPNNKNRDEDSDIIFVQ